MERGAARGTGRLAARRAALALAALVGCSASGGSGPGRPGPRAGERADSQTPTDVPCQGRRVLVDRRTADRVVIEYGRCRTTSPVLIVSDGLFGFVDAAGRIVVSPRFAYASEFSEGLAFVRSAGSYGYIDLEGRLAIRLPDSATVSARLVAVEVRAAAAAPGDTARERCALQVAPFGPSPLDFTPPQTFTVCGDTLPSTAPDTARYAGPRWRYASREGAGDFFDGRARVRFGAKWGYIDRSGRLVIPARFDEASDFLDGYARVVVAGSTAWIDPSGRIVATEDPRRAT